MIQAAHEFMEINPHELKNHPLNIQVYGDAVDDDFVESCTDGIREPIVITSDYHIISGHRRKAAAQQLGFKTVTCRVLSDLEYDSPQAEYELLLANKQRNKTEEQRAREIANLLRVQELLRPAKPAGRPKAVTEKSVSKPKPINEPKPSLVNIQEAAQQAGVGVGKARQAVKVVKAIDEAEAAGDVETAESIRETLNTKSVSAAHEQVRGKPTKKPKSAPFAKLEKLFGQLLREVDSTAQSLGGKGVHHQVVTGQMESLHAKILKWKKDAT